MVAHVGCNNIAHGCGLCNHACTFTVSSLTHPLWSISVGTKNGEVHNVTVSTSIRFIVAWLSYEVIHTNFKSLLMQRFPWIFVEVMHGDHAVEDMVD